MVWDHTADYYECRECGLAFKEEEFLIGKGLIEENQNLLREVSLLKRKITVIDNTHKRIRQHEELKSNYLALKIRFVRIRKFVTALEDTIKDISGELAVQPSKEGEPMRKFVCPSIDEHVFTDEGVCCYCGVKEPKKIEPPKIVPREPPPEKGMKITGESGLEPL